MRRIFLVVFITLFTDFAWSDDVDVVKPTTDFSKAEPYEALPAGALTHQKKLNAFVI